uniref:Hemicentin/VWA7 galactose-binding domain-containing protein n=1 Tax=Hippocampus comes TaxID=109280 RepID=A0A3Q2YDN5_HIPCM
MFKMCVNLTFLMGIVFFPILFENSLCCLFQVTVFQIMMNPGKPDNFTFTIDSSLRNITIYITGTLRHCNIKIIHR